MANKLSTVLRRLAGGAKGASDRSPSAETTAHPLAQRPGWIQSPRGWTFDPASLEVSQDYAEIDRDRAIEMSDDAWHFEDVARRQHEAFTGLLADLDRGEVREDFAVAQQAVLATDLASMRLLEIGCGSGYYSEVFEKLVPGRVDYQGIDYSVSMVRVARAAYGAGRFAVADACALPFPDASFDVVMNGVSLMHITDYAQAIRETRRVARRYALFHTTIVVEGRETVFLEKKAYGRRVVEIILNESEFLKLATDQGLSLVRQWESIPYNLVDEIGEPTHARTYLFAVSGDAVAGPPQPERRPRRGLSKNGQMLNLGCGTHYHPQWINLDVNVGDPGVIEHNILDPLPFADGTFNVVYHSHVLEHLPKDRARGFLAECHRVLAPGGLIRVVVPDLEQICRHYVDLVARAAEGDKDAAARYDWIVLELLDQMARQRSGGEMLDYWRQDPMPAHDFVMERVGHEAASAIESIRAGAMPEPSHGAPDETELGRFRLSGEVHQWMYDRFSLSRLLRAAGFIEPIERKASESAIADFARFGLDTMPNGSVRKPDSLFFEARRHRI